MALTTIEYPIEPTTPIFHVPLSNDNLRMLGELCAIQGQIEFIMQLNVMVIRKTSLPRARKLLGSSNIMSNAKVWLDAVEEKAPRQEIKDLAKAITGEIDVIRQGRNDFVHAVFASANDDEDGFLIEVDPAVDASQKSRKPAVAVHNLKKKPMANLKNTRDKAAAISRLIFHVYTNSGGNIPAT